jgi:hypothetical protein
MSPVIPCARSRGFNQLGVSRGRLRHRGVQPAAVMLEQTACHNTARRLICLNAAS